MIVYKDMSFCARMACPNTECPRHRSNVEGNIPEYMGISVADFWRKYKHCPKEAPGRVAGFFEEDSDK